MYFLWKITVMVLCIKFSCSFVLTHDGFYKLDIIHFNDFHARFEETSPTTPICRFNNGSCLGGFSRLYTVVTALKEKKPQSILLNAGDSFQGTYWYTLLKWQVTQEFMNLLPHDAHALGNHDFDDGPTGLAPYISALNAPVVAANMDSTREPVLRNLYEPYVILQRGGRKIGVIGLITPDTKTLSLTGNVEFTDPSEATRREAIKLTKMGVDIIVVLSHCGYDVDVALAREHGQYIDVIVGGHSHRDESYFIPYLSVVEADQDTSKKVVVVQAFAFTKAVGDLSVYFDVNGDVAKWEGEPIYLNNSIPEDEEIKKKLQPYAELVHTAERTPIGIIKSTLDYRDCARGECIVGDILVDALNYWAKQFIKSKHGYISFVQRTNINAIVPAGLITKGALIDLFPYYDFVETFEMKGKHILKALERSVSELSSLKPLDAPWLLQISGLHVVYNVSKAEGERVIDAYVGSYGEGHRLNKDAYYQVTAPAYLADGGDGYLVFKNEKRHMKIIGRDQILLEKYIKKFSPVTGKIDGRINITF
ncbi:PREDICTED: apyrase-like [Papilio polytes]|uniref:apyrase-like n=1 Tax=Papilio polytes TaxID=76194 RepID=UPI0006766A74|nr:PREDICTED: apyrase-like [Papilio polytes]